MAIFTQFQDRNTNPLLVCVEHITHVTRYGENSILHLMTKERIELSMPYEEVVEKIQELTGSEEDFDIL